MKEIIKKYRMIINYFSHSVMSTLLDTVIVWILFHTVQMSITLANTCGVIAGFVLGFFLDVKNTFKSNYTVMSFLVYFGTFLLGLFLADVLITVTMLMVANKLPELLAFLISKGVSVAVPFFIMYFIRKYAYRALNNNRSGK